MIAKLGRIVLPILVIAAALVASGYLVATRERPAPTAPREQVWTVDTAIVRIADVRPNLRLFAEVVAGREVDLRALVAGEVVEVGPTYAEGGSVHKGELIAAIDPFDYQTAIDDIRAQTAEAQARLRELAARHQSEADALTRDREMLGLLESDLQRTGSLHARGNLSIKALDQVKMDLARQRQTVAMRENALNAEDARKDQQQAAIERLKIALRRAERALRDTRLKAPFDGFLSQTEAQIGRRVGVNDRVARLIDAGRLEARMHLSDDQYGRLLVEPEGLIGREVVVIWRVGGRELRYSARIERVGPRIEAASGGIELFARLSEVRLESPIRPGAFVEVRLPDITYQQVARLPEAALRNQDTVYVVVDGRLLRRAVQLAGRIGNDVLVRGELGNGDSVVITPYPRIGPGQRVRVP